MLHRHLKLITIKSMQQFAYDKRSSEKIQARIPCKSYPLAREENVKMDSGLCVGVVEYGVFFPLWMWWVNIVWVTLHSFLPYMHPKGKRNFPPLVSELGWCVPEVFGSFASLFPAKWRTLAAVRDNWKLERGLRSQRDGWME